MKDLINKLRFLKKWLLRFTLIFWLVETAYFIWLLGWHIVAANPQEANYDNLVDVAINVWWCASIITMMLDFIWHVREDYLNHR